MRLKTTYKSKGGTAKKKDAPKLSKKEEKLYKPCKNYTDETVSKVANTLIEFSNVTYGTIKSFKCDYVLTEEGRIGLENSWEELILKLLYSAIQNNADNFKDLLSVYEITGNDVSIDKNYGKCDLSGKHYKVYKVYNTDYYLEALFNNKNIYSMVGGLLKLNKIPYKNIKLHLVNNDYDIRVGNDELQVRSFEVEIGDVAKYIDDDCELMGVKVEDSIIKADRIEIALLLICNYVLDNNGAEQLDKIEPVGNTGITDLSESDYIGIPNTQIGKSDYIVYSDLDTDDVIGFINGISDSLSLDIKMLFRKEGPAHEWEIE